MIKWNRDKTTAADVASDERAAVDDLRATRVAKKRELTERNARDAALWDERVEALPAYLPKPICPKCGDRGISVKFDRPVFSSFDPGMASIYTYYPSYSGEPASAKHAMLHHKCGHCGYGWDTRTADHGQLSPQAVSKGASK